MSKEKEESKKRTPVELLAEIDSFDIFGGSVTDASYPKQAKRSRKEERDDIATASFVNDTVVDSTMEYIKNRIDKSGSDIATRRDIAYYLYQQYNLESVETKAALLDRVADLPKEQVFTVAAVLSNSTCEKIFGGSHIVQERRSDYVNPSAADRIIEKV